MSSSVDATTFQERQKIRELADQYFFHCDNQNATAVANCFAKNGKLSSATQKEMKLEGREGLEAGFRNLLTRGKTCHLIASMDIAVDGQRASGKLFALAYVAGAGEPGAPILVRGLAYTDTYIMEDGRWVIATRVHEAHWQFQSTLIGTLLPPSPSK